jgi:hypothetical protein
MPADLASRMTLALADAGESRLDRSPATRRCSITVTIGSVFYASLISDVDYMPNGLQCALLFGTRSAQSTRASGHTCRIKRPDT